MKGYILAVAGAILLSAIVSVIAPSGKMGKFVKGAAKLLVLLSLLAPILSIAKGELALPVSDVGMDGEYLAKCAQMLAEQDERDIEQMLVSRFSVEGRALVVRTAEAGFPVEKLEVKITDFGIIGQEGHIYTMSRIEETLEKQYGCAAEVS